MATHFPCPISADAPFVNLAHEYCPKLKQTVQIQPQLIAARDGNYNCFGYSVGDTQTLWDPQSATGPIAANARPDASNGTFDAQAVRDFYTQHGYVECTAAEAEIDVYGSLGWHAHAAKFHSNSPAGEVWASKMGQLYVMSHGRNDLVGEQFGQIINHYKKKNGPPVRGGAPSASGHPPTTPHPPHAGPSSTGHPKIVVHSTTEDNNVAAVQDLAASVAAIKAKAPGKPAPTASHGPPASSSSSSHAPTAAPPRAPTHPPTTTPNHPPKTPNTGTGTEPSAADVNTFKKDFAAWKATWTKGVNALSSTSRTITRGPEWQALLALNKKSPIVTEVVSELTDPSNLWAVVLYNQVALHPTDRVLGQSLQVARATIVQKYGHHVQRVQAKVAQFAVQQDLMRNTGGNPTTELLNHGSFAELVKEGKAAIPIIMQAYEKDPAGFWGEILKQIEAQQGTATGGGGVVDTVHGEVQYAHWLAKFLGEVEAAAEAVGSEVTAPAASAPAAGQSS